MDSRFLTDEVNVVDSQQSFCTRFAGRKMLTLIGSMPQISAETESLEVLQFVSGCEIIDILTSDSRIIRRYDGDEMQVGSIYTAEFGIISAGYFTESDIVVDT